MDVDSVNRRPTLHYLSPMLDFHSEDSPLLHLSLVACTQPVDSVNRRPTVHHLSPMLVFNTVHSGDSPLLHLCLVACTQPSHSLSAAGA